MPPQKKKRKYKRAYDFDDMKDAYNAWETGEMTARKSAKHFGVPFSTLAQRINGNIPLEDIKSGQKPLMNKEEEHNLARLLEKMAKARNGMTVHEVCKCATDYAIRLGKREEGAQIFTNRWYYTFLSRNPGLRIDQPIQWKTPEKKTRRPDEIEVYFDHLFTLLETNKLLGKPERVYVLGEQVLDPCFKKPRKVSLKFNPENPPPVITLLVCGNAVGEVLPPFYVFPGENEKPWADDSMSGSRGTTSEAGYPDPVCYKEFLENHFFENMDTPPSAEDPVLLIHNGKTSDVPGHLIDWASERHLKLFSFLEHTSHICHPLEGSCLEDLEKLFNRKKMAILAKLDDDNPDDGISREQVCQLTSQVYAQAVPSKKLSLGFKLTGIYPFTGIDAIEGLPFFTTPPDQVEPKVKVEPSPEFDQQEGQEQPAEELIIDDDVFICGHCKAQFNIFYLFVEHKKSHDKHFCDKMLDFV